MNQLSLYFLTLVFAISVAANAAVPLASHERYTWTLDQKALEQRLSGEVSIEELIQILKMEGIDVVLEQRELTLWKKNRISISLSPVPFTTYHLCIAVEGRQTLDECTDDELAELYAAIWIARKALTTATGAGSFLIFTTECERSGKDSSTLGVEIVPSGMGENKEAMDALEKYALNDYFYYNISSPHTFVRSPETIAILQKELQMLEPVIQPEMQQDRWSQKLLHHREALYEGLKAIHDDLAQMGALIDGELPSYPIFDGSVQETLINLDRCAFCNPKVIEQQLVCDWKEVQILLGHKPTSLYGNFLILPKRHQCSWDLTQEEAIASFEAIIALKNMYANILGSKDWICYIQDGPAVGQTVPHTHIHYFILPDRLKHVIIGLQHIHNQRRILSAEENRLQCETIKPLLLEQLLRRQKH